MHNFCYITVYPVICVFQVKGKIIWVNLESAKGEFGPTWIERRPSGSDNFDF